MAEIVMTHAVTSPADFLTSPAEMVGLVNIIYY